MEITILHLTDIHFTVKTDFNKRTEPIARAIISELGKSRILFLVISGDVASSGKKEEYENASKFLSVLKTLLTSSKPGLVLHFIIVPGNHDCNFLYSNQVRSNILSNINYQTYGTDNSVRDIGLETQKDFWEFYKLYNKQPEDKLYYVINYTIDEFIISFHCINTAWMSKINEDVGSLFFPVKLYSDLNKIENSLNFGVWHHPYNWFNPNTTENNKLEFEQFTELISATHFFGHEHKQQFIVSSNRDSNQTINLLSGEILNDDKKPNKSAFQILKISGNNEQGEIKVYSLEGAIYELKSTREISFFQEYKRRFSLSKDYVKNISEMKIPMLIDNKKNITLPEIFVFPDLESSSKDSDKLEQYFSAYRILESNETVIIIDGDSQIGKTSLLTMYFLKFYDKNIYPLYFAGKELTETVIGKNLKKVFKSQYSEDSNFEEFRQLDKSKKVLLIDNFQDCQFNSQATKDLIENCLESFGKIIIVFDSSNNILSNLKLEFKKGYYCTIKPFGYKKRNELVERYYQLSVNPNTYNEQIILSEVKNTFDGVQAVLGDRLMPAYPVFLLSIVQALQYKPIKQNETSFGYCYQTLINYALMKAGVRNEDIDTFLNFLTEFAYFFVLNEADELSSLQVNTFYAEYSSKFITPSLSEVVRMLKAAKIIDIQDDVFKFSYNYILYFLSAKKMADSIHTESGKKMITKLFSNLQNERNANILVFITHHSRDISFIEESLLNSMILLDKHNPITLAKEDPFYDEIRVLAESIKSDLIEGDRNQKQERERQIIANDKFEKNQQKNNSEEFENPETNEIVTPFIQSSRSIEIIGQIVKNRKGSLEIGHLNDLVTEIYTTGFRTIGYFSELLKTMKQELKETLDREIESSDSRIEMERKILAFLQMASLKLCLNIFTKLTFCVGTKELKDIYVEVSNKINTPAAKLVTFSINSYYGNVSVSEVKSLAEDFKDNIVAMQILRSKVRFYVYNRNLDYSTKQKLASACKMTLLPPKIRHEGR